MWRLPELRARAGGGWLWLRVVVLCARCGAPPPDMIMVDDHSYARARWLVAVVCLLLPRTTTAARRDWGAVAPGVQGTTASAAAPCCLMVHAVAAR